MSPSPRIAVIIVNWNGGEFLVKCLTALRAQTQSPTRVIVVDNASSDDSCARVERDFPEVKLVRADANLGFAAGNNLGVQHAGDCDWIALLNPDAYADPDWLAALARAAARHPDSAAFGCRMLMAETPDYLDGVGDAYHTSGLVWREGHGQAAAGAWLEEREIFSPCAAAALYRRDVWAAAGGLDEDYFCYVEDVDLGFRIRLMGHPSWYVPDAVVRHEGSALTGKRSDFSIYHGHRNLVWTYVKDMPGAAFWLYLPWHVALNLATLAMLILGGHGAPALKAKRDALRGLPRAWRKRRVVQSAARAAGVSWPQMRTCMRRGATALFRRR